MTRAQQLATFLTAFVLFMVVLVLCLTHLRWPGERTWPPEPQPYIEMALDEFIEPVEIPEPTYTPGAEDAPALTETDLDNPAQTAPESGVQRVAAGETAPPAKTVVTEQPSRAKEKPSKTQPKTGANEDNARRQQQATARRTENITANALAQSNAKNNANNNNGDTGRAGRRTGRADSNGPAKSKSTSRGNHIGGGFGWPALRPNIATDRLGTVTVEFTINPDGSASGARVIKVTNTCDDASLKRACERYINSLHFPHKGSERPTAPITGNTIVFTFENPN